jgi:hypothetical protein
MAESPSSSTAEGPKRSQEFWAVAALGVAAVVCLTLLAVALVLILSRNSTPAAAPQAPIQFSNFGNIVGPQPVAAVSPSAVNDGIHRGDEQSARAAAMDHTQGALPGQAPVPLPDWSRRKLALTRADPPSPPSPQNIINPDKVFFRVREDPASYYQGQKPLPMPIRYAPDAQGKVAQVFATKDAPAATDAGRFSYTADVPYADSGIRGQSLDLQLSEPRKTSSVDGFRAPKGFQFFTAKLSLANQGSQPVQLSVDDLEVHDEDGVRYLVNPELVFGSWPDPSLAAGASTQVELSFLVPEEAPLKEMAVQEAPGRVVLVPLQSR